MLTYNLEKRAQVPIYEYLYKCIKNDIICGKIKSGDKLPSKRGFAKHLDISVITVENAYAQLLLEGYIYSVEKSGYFVSKIDTPRSSVMPKAQQNPFVKKENTQYFIDFTANNIASGMFPFSVWSKLMRRVLTEQDKNLLEPVSHNGLYQLRQAIAQHLYSFHGIDVPPSRIVIGSGTEYLYSMIIQLLGRENTVAIENPGYDKIARTYISCGAKCEYIDVDKCGMSAFALKKSRAEVAHISPSHHFPTGTVMPIGRRYEFLKWANEKNGRYIIEDDYDSEFRFSGRPAAPLISIDSGGRVIYMNTFSKTIAPSMRISYMVLPDTLMAAYNRQLGFYACPVTSFEQYALAMFISEGYFEKHIARMKNFYKIRRDAVISAIEASKLHGIVTIKEADAGLHFLLEIDTQLSDTELKKRLLSCGINISFLSQYIHGAKSDFTHTAVINYSGGDTEKISRAVRLAEKIL